MTKRRRLNFAMKVMRDEEQSPSDHGGSDDHSDASSYQDKRKRKALTKSSNTSKSAESPRKLVPRGLGGETYLHTSSSHVIKSPGVLQDTLLEWYRTVHTTRGMPWRKPFNPHLGPEERSLDLRNHATTNSSGDRDTLLHSLDGEAGANVEEVNALWKGLGYYSRASRLLSGAQKAVAKYHGRLPDNAKDLEADIPGIGRYSAGAIASIAYGEHVPVLDGNVNRLLSRLLALHAPPKAKATLDILWAAAAAMVESTDSQKSPSNGDTSSGSSEMPKYPGDINQALIELGSTICKSIRDLASWLRGLLAGLYEFPTSSDVAKTTSTTAQAKIPMTLLGQLFNSPVSLYDSKDKTEALSDGFVIATIKPAGDVLHIFSHIKKTYRPQWVVIQGGESPPALKASGITFSATKTIDLTDTNEEDSLKPHLPTNAFWVRMEDVPGVNTLAAVSLVALSEPEKGLHSRGLVLMYNHDAFDVYEAGGMAHSAQVASAAQNDLYYSCLNVARTATPVEIAEQYRTLSLVFHPDKQLDEECKQIAIKTFQELSKSYEVLSDPFLREVYDSRGEDGLKFIQSEQFKTMSREEVKLNNFKLYIGPSDLHSKMRKALLDPPRLRRGSENKQQETGVVILGIDASSFSCPYQGSKDNTLARQILNRCEDVQITTFGLSRIFQRSINAQTSAFLECQLFQQGRDRTIRQLVGTVRHQFSPRLMSELSIGLLPHLLTLSTEYEFQGTHLSAQVMSSHVQPMPTLKLSASRQLYYGWPEVASIELDITKIPRYTFKLKSLSNFGMQDTATLLLPSNSGLRDGISKTSIGVAFQFILPTFIVEQTLNFTELALQLKMDLKYTLYMGFEWVCSGTWAYQPQSEITLSTSLGFSGVSFVLDIIHEGSAFSLPLVLAIEPNSTIACCGVIFPASLALFSYHFVLKPRQRMYRLERIRAMQRELEESGGMRRDREVILNMLKPTARKSKEAEATKGGLVITKATWGSICEKSDAGKFLVDVIGPSRIYEALETQLHLTAKFSALDIFSTTGVIMQKFERIFP
ncbi:hypothetical protein C0995_001846 [Termitomyces sp. Mi166|nr:hypothetical protein C0995_001846 [Termitomyces sp. Mi166\